MGSQAVHPLLSSSLWACLRASKPGGGHQLCPYPTAETSGPPWVYERRGSSMCHHLFCIYVPPTSRPRWQLPARAWQRSSTALVPVAQGLVIWVPCQKPTIQTAKLHAERIKWKLCLFYFWFNVKGMMGTLHRSDLLGSSVFTSPLKSALNR